MPDSVLGADAAPTDALPPDPQRGPLVAWLLTEDPAHDDSLLAAWIIAGLLRRERVLCLSDGVSGEELRALLRERRLDPRPYQREGLLVAGSAAQEIFEGGRVDPQGVADLLQSEAQVAKTVGHRGLRVWVDTRGLVSLLSDARAVLKLLRVLDAQCEASACGRVLLGYAPSGLPAATLTAVLHGHRQLLVQGEPLPNGAYVAPERQLSEVGPSLVLSERLRSLREAPKEAPRGAEELGYRNLIAGLPVAVVYLGARGTVRYASPDVERFLGATPQRLVGHHALELLAPEDRKRGSKALSALMASSTRRGPEVYNLVRADGQRHQAELHASSTVDGQGTLQGITLVLGDVSPARHLATELQRKNRFQQILLDAIPKPIFFKDARGLYLGCNTSFERLIGKTREQLVGRSVFELAPEELARVYYARDAELFAKPGVQRYESTVVDGQGRSRDVIFHKATFADERGGVGGLIGTIIDATELRGVERALRESEARLQAANDALERQVDARAAELQVVHRLAGELGFVRAPADLAWLVLEELQRVVPHDLVGLLLQERGGVPRVYLRAHRHVDPGLVHQVEQELTAAAKNEPRPRFRTQATPSQELRTFTPPGGDATLPVAAFGSEVRVPLQLREGSATFGMLYVARGGAEGIDANQRRLLRIVAHQAAEALARIHTLLDQEQRRLESIVRHLPCGVLLLDGERRIRFLNPRATQYLPLLTREREGDVLTRLGPLLAESLVPDGREVEVEVEPVGARARTFALSLVAIAGSTDAGQAQTVVMIRDETERAAQRRSVPPPAASVGPSDTGELAVVPTGRAESPLDLLLQGRSGVREGDESNTARLVMAQLRGWETLLLVSQRAAPRGALARTLRELGYKVIGVPDEARARAVGEDHRGPLHLLVVDLDLPPAGGLALTEALSQVRPALKALYVVQRDARGGGAVLPRGAAALVAPFAQATLARKVREVLDGRA